MKFRQRLQLPPYPNQKRLEHQRRDDKQSHIIGMQRVFSECGSSRDREESWCNHIRPWNKITFEHPTEQEERPLFSFLAFLLDWSFARWLSPTSTWGFLSNSHSFLSFNKKTLTSLKGMEDNNSGTRSGRRHRRSQFVMKLRLRSWTK